MLTLSCIQLNHDPDINLEPILPIGEKQNKKSDNTFSHDLLFLIFQFCALQDLIHIKQVNRQWSQVCERPKIQWKLQWCKDIVTIISPLKTTPKVKTFVPLNVPGRSIPPHPYNDSLVSLPLPTEPITNAIQNGFVVFQEKFTGPRLIKGTFWRREKFHVALIGIFFSYVDGAIPSRCQHEIIRLAATIANKKLQRRRQ